MRSIRLIRPLLVAALMTLMLPATAAALPQLVVRATPLNEVVPARSAGYLMFAQGREFYRFKWDAFVQPDGSAPIKLNTSHSAVPGGISGTRAVFQIYTDNESNIRYYDLVTHVRTAFPPAVNTGRWEWDPSVSGDWLLFARRNFSVRPESDRILLYNMVSEELRVLAEATGNPDIDLRVGQVNGDYAVWDRCVPSHHVCGIVRYQISTGQRLFVPRPTGRVNFAASVSSAGDVFFARSGWTCGSYVNLRRWTPGVAEVQLVALRKGQDVGNSTFVYDAPGGGMRFMYARTPCTNIEFDLYEVVSP